MVQRSMSVTGPKLAVDRILIGDCLAELAKLPDGCIDLVFADPPYNLQLDGDLLRPNTPWSMACIRPGTSS